MPEKSHSEPGRPRLAWRLRRWTAGSAVLIVSGVLIGAAPTTSTALGVAQDDSVSVIVTGADAESTASQVRSAGGTVTAELELINGVAADLPEGTGLPAGLRVFPDRTVTFATADPAAGMPTSTVRETLGLPANGSEGKGVTVALVDTGVADVPDLRGLVDHIDVTGSGPGDGYGHGTYLAGMIVGSGAASNGRYQGVAPGARLLDVKVADAAGVTSLSLVLEGLQAVAATASTYGTKVVNLSLASGSPMPYQVDPLNQALRILWHRGFTVVVASGNDGPGAGSVSSPGNDPTLITAGGLNEAFSAERSDDSVADWSGRGPTSQGVSKPDLVSPGAHIVGLRSPASVVDNAHPVARVGDHYFRGSGTSASAAVTSAAVAGILSRNPELKPDQLKYLLTASAYRGAGLSKAAGAGAGGLDLRAAFQMASSPRVLNAGPAQTAAPGDPGKWAALSAAFAAGDRAAADKAWSELGPEARSWIARSWISVDPVARSWIARSWIASSWGDEEVTSKDWAARVWAARSWIGDDWAARSWIGNDWAARSWIGDDWAARSWIGDDWAARSWIGDDWAARSWIGDSWSARSWIANWR